MQFLLNISMIIKSLTKSDISKYISCNVKSLYLNTSGVFFGNYFLYGSGYKYVARLIHKIFAFVWLGSRKANDSTIFYAIFF